MNLRVSTPMHAENAKRMGQWRAAVQERYYAELDQAAVTLSVLAARDAVAAAD